MTTLMTTGEELEFLPQRNSPCLHKLSVQRSWVRTLAVRNGDHLVGVRVNTEWAADLLKELLSGVRVYELDEVAPPNFSVELASSSPDGSRHRHLHLIYRDHAVVARRADTEEILLDLVELLHEPQRWLETRGPAVHASALTLGGGGVALLPWEWHEVLLSHQRRLRLRGHELLAPRTHLLEGGLLTTDTATTGRTTRPAKRLPVRLWAVDVPGGGTAPLRPAAGVHAAARGIANVEVIGAHRVLEGLAELARGGLPFHGTSARSRTPLSTAMRLVERAETGEALASPVPHVSAPAEISPESLCPDESTNLSVELSTHT